MKNQYVGDVGDYGKYGLLRFLADHDIRIGVNWYLTEDDGSADGRFTHYLKQPSEEIYDPDLYKALQRIASCNDKTVQMVEDARIIPGATFYNEVLRSSSLEAGARDSFRKQWFDASLPLHQDAELIFADPDNGISYRKTAKTKDSEKFILPDEVARYYNAGKNVVYYCHKGRRKQDDWEQAKIEIKDHVKAAQILGVTFHRGTQRSYIFVVHPESYHKYEEILSDFLKTKWGKLFSWEEIGVDRKSTVKKAFYKESPMKIATITFTLRAPWVHSVKEKRMIVKSLIAKLQNKFHVSAAEIDEQDTHQLIVIGVAAIVPHAAMADSLMDEISRFVEENTEAEIIDEQQEIR